MSATLNAGSFRSDDTLYGASRTLKSYLRSILMHKHGMIRLPQLVAIDDCAMSARHVVEDAALDKRVYARVAEQDQRCTIIIAARIARDLPSLREQLIDRQRYAQSILHV